MSRRFKNRHRKVEAAPDAKAPKSMDHAPAELDDSNSFTLPHEPGMRYANQLNSRAFVAAESAHKPKRKKKAGAGDDAEGDGE